MKRPLIITIICVLGYLSVLFTFPQVFSPSVKKMGVLVPALYGLLVAAHFISCVGIWYMKRWGVQLYLVAFFARVLFILQTDQAGALFYVSSAVSVIFITVLVRFYQKMDQNL